MQVMMVNPCWEWVSEWVNGDPRSGWSSGIWGSSKQSYSNTTWGLSVCIIESRDVWHLERKIRAKSWKYCTFISQSHAGPLFRVPLPELLSHWLNILRLSVFFSISRYFWPPKTSSETLLVTTSMFTVVPTVISNSNRTSQVKPRIKTQYSYSSTRKSSPGPILCYAC